MNNGAERIENNSEAEEISEAEKVLGGMPSFGEFQKAECFADLMHIYEAGMGTHIDSDNDNARKAIEEALSIDDGRDVFSKLRDKVNSDYEAFDRGGTENFGAFDVIASLIDANVIEHIERSEDKEVGYADGLILLNSLNESIANPKIKTELQSRGKIVEEFVDRYKQGRADGTIEQTFEDYLQSLSASYRLTEYSAQNGVGEHLDEAQREELKAINKAIQDLSALKMKEQKFSEVLPLSRALSINSQSVLREEYWPTSFDVQDSLPNDEVFYENENDSKPELQLSLDEVRKMHIDYINGDYSPSLEEWDLILDDEDFYKSDVYIQYRKQQIDKIAEERSDIYAPTDEKIIHTMEPFFELIRQSSEEILKLGAKLEEGEISGESVSSLVRFFSEMYGVQEAPAIELIEDGDADGSYSHADNKILLKYTADGKNSVADIADTIAHETWHAFQHQCENSREDYKTNFNNYYKSSMDYDAYCNQLVEKEAYLIGDIVGETYRREFLRAHPELLQDLNQRYYEWLDGKNDPSETEDSYDYKYLVMAHEITKEGGIAKRYNRGNVLSHLFKRFRKEKR